MTTRITIAITDKSKHMHEHPPLVRLFRIASLFCTLCISKHINNKVKNLHQYNKTINLIGAICIAM